MSLERELLKRILATRWLDHELSCEVEELLAQPEQEPVAWCQMVKGKVQDLLTSFEMKDWIQDDSWIPLYTAQPKREPLSEAAICKMLINKVWQGCVHFVRMIEKAHGIGVDNE